MPNAKYSDVLKRAEKINVSNYRFHSRSPKKSENEQKKLFSIIIIRIKRSFVMTKP